MELCQVLQQLTAKLAEVLGVAPGNDVIVEVLEGARPIHEVRVTGVAERRCLGACPPRSPSAPWFMTCVSFVTFATFVVNSTA